VGVDVIDPGEELAGEDVGGCSGRDDASAVEDDQVVAELGGDV
jgi:hypothetical protein